jgi:hypothetical protein
MIVTNKFLTYESEFGTKIVIDKLYDKGSEILYDKYLVNKWPYYASEDIMHWNDNILLENFFKIDKGESKFSLLNKWIPEDEPVNNKKKIF